MFLKKLRKHPCIIFADPPKKSATFLGFFSTAEVGEQCASTLGVQKLRFGGIMIIMARLYLDLFGS